MITVQEALQYIHSAVTNFGTLEIPLSTSNGHVLKEDWITDRALPPYDRVTMDGIAISYDHFKKGQRSFVIQGIAAAGAPQLHLKNSAHCIEVMTGSILPKGCDTVIRYEDLTVSDNKAYVQIEEIKYQQNIHFKGSHQPTGALIVPKNTILSSAEIGVGASIGKSKVVVAKRPNVIVISTGDELVPITSAPLPHQIRRSNIHQLVAALKKQNILADSDHLSDNREAIKNKLSQYINTYDAIILSGGVSKGKFDFIPQVLEELGVEKQFHKIKQRPGKPFWFGKYINKMKGQCVIFALPGNPNSTYLCLHKYFNYWLELCLTGRKPIYNNAQLTADFTFKKELTLFQEVKLSYNKEGQLLATPVKGNGSGDLSNLVNADAFIELPLEEGIFKAGSSYPIIPYR